MMNVFTLFGVATPAPVPAPNVAVDIDVFGNELLKHIGVGQGQAVSSFYLASKMGMPRERTEVYLREMIGRLIAEKDWPIGSCSEGYFIIDNMLELDSTTENLLSRIRGLIRRIRGIRRGWGKRKASLRSGGNFPW